MEKMNMVCNEVKGKNNTPTLYIYIYTEVYILYII